MKKLLITVSVIVVVGIAGFIVFSQLTSAKVPQAFTDKHNEKVALEKAAALASDLNNLPEWIAFNEQMDAKNYTEAAKSIAVALQKKEEAARNIAAIDGKLVELESISADITNAEVQTSARNFISVAREENVAKGTYNNLQKQMIEKLKAMVDILAKNSTTISATDEKTIGTLSKEIDGLKTPIDEAATALDTTQSRYKTTETEFFTLAGLTVAK
jgi:hypothetical protein